MYSKLEKNIMNILVPRNIEGRKETLRQNNIKLLGQEVIKSSLDIDELFEGISLELIKVKEIYGDVHISLKKGYIPSWLKDIKIHGYFDCSFNKLTSLKNCPQYVDGYFYCNYNNLTSLEGCPKYIVGNLFCRDNTKILTLPNDVHLKGILYNE